MEVLIFKTNIRYKKQINAVRRHIDGEPQIIRWNIDLHDFDKILRVETVDLHPAKIERLVKSAGYSCEELKE